MTDLERARALFRAGYWSRDELAPAIAEALAAARREGAEGAEAAVIAARKNEYMAGYRRGAEEMRERAARWFEAAHYVASIWSWGIADAIRALPLSPCPEPGDEPTSP